MATITGAEQGQSPVETILELVQLPDGEIVLRPAGTQEEPLVSIRFSAKVQEMLGEQLEGVGQHMIQSALKLVMERQMARWQAQVMDEEPAHYS